MTSPDFVKKTEDLAQNEKEIEEEVEHDLDETDAGPLEHHVGAEDTTDPVEED